MANAVATLVVKAVADVKDATGGLDEVASRSDKMKQGLSTAAKVATGVLVGLGAAMVSAGNAAAEDAQGAAILAQSLQKATGATKDQVAGVEDWISSMSAATGVADDQLRPALAVLARATGDVTQSQDALKVAMDVAAATGTDVESVSKAIAKGYGGQTTAIGRLVPGIDKAVLASGDMNAVMAELSRTMGGSAAVAADTTAGKMQRAQVAMQEAKEAIGAGLLPVLGKLAGLLGTVGTFAQTHSTSFLVIAGAVAALAVATIAANAAISVATAVTGAWAAAQLLANSTLGVRIGLLAIDAAAWVRSTAMVIANTAATIAGQAASIAMSAAIGVVTAAQWLWNAALTANPIGIVIVLIAAMIAAVILLWRNSETFRSIVLALWDAMKSGASAVASAVSSAFATVKDAIASAFNWVKSNWPTILAILTGPIGIAVALIIKNWDTIKSAFKSVTDYIENVWQGTVAALKSAVSGLGAVLSAPFEAMQSAIQWVINKVSDLIGWLSRIHVPKIDLPGPFAVGGAAAPVAARGVRAPGVPTSRTSSSSSSMVVINVTGAIDPEATARQIRRILAGSDRRTGLTA